MPPRVKRRVFIYFFLILYLAIITLKIVFTLNSSGFLDYNARNASRIENIISVKNDYSFIVVGNIKNSVNVFEKKLIPLINQSDADFVVLLGDSVLDGANDKYASLYLNLQKVNKPVLFTFGDTELSDNGAKNYFHHIGSPLFFFIAGESEFIFLDTTGYTEESYQLNWTKNLLQNFDNVKNRFIFMNRSPISNEEKKLEFEKKYMMSSTFKQNVINLFSETGVLAVISSNNGEYTQETMDDVTYMSTGGGGGGASELQDSQNFFHIIEVNITKNNLSTVLLKSESENLPIRLAFFRYVWNIIYSWVYVYFLNLLLIISILFLGVFLIYTKLIQRIDYYPDLINTVKNDYPLTIAMFTNNYLPFIGGVPLSILRLKQGLEEKGHTVHIFAPAYDAANDSEKCTGVFRCKPFFHYKKGDLIAPVSNIFSSRIRKEFKRINPDIVHVHHPFWLGSVGKHLAARYKKPVVFTYHTRLEQYNHYVPVFHHLAGGQIPHLLIKYFASACDAVIAPTRSAKKYLRNLGIGKLIIVQPTGIDLNLFGSEKSRGLPSFIQNDTLSVYGKRIQLFTVFRLSKEKCPYFLLDGIQKLAVLTDIPFVCFIAGSGPEESSMHEYIKAHNLQEYVVMLGSIPPGEIPQYYSETDIFVFSSQSETQGMVLLEAMAGGSPVVAVNSSGISDMISNGVNGFKTEPNVDIWVGKIKELLENRDERERMSKEALKTAEGYSLSHMGENILEMYYEIIDWKKKHPNQTFIR